MMSIRDRVRPEKRTRTRAFLIGLGSLIDLRGIATYEAMQDLMPDPALRPMKLIYRDTNRLMVSTLDSSSGSHSSSPR